MRHTRLKEHVYHTSGEAKTVCVSACLTALGVSIDSFHYTGTINDGRRESILRRHGYKVRSRKSSMPGLTIGQVRKGIQKLKDSADTKYLVIVNGDSYCHCMLLDSDGKTVVDTDPRKRDKRKVHSIKAVFK